MDKVLIIDDDRFTQNLLQKSLFQHYEVRTADDGTTGLYVANQWQPDVILLDVEMPGKNGYEVCDALKQAPETHDIPVVFLSSHTSTREHLLGFEVGGDDFLVKPCSEKVLRKKLAILSDYFKQKKSLKNTISTAEKTAHQALTTSFELGKSVRFVERTYSTPNYEALGKAIMEVMSDLSLSACVMFKTEGGPKYYSTSGAVAPLEMDILTKLHGEARFLDFGCRTQVNYPQVALLVKNMPLQDRVRYGRIKDTLPFVLGATDAKIRVLDAEQALRAQNEQVLYSVKVLDKLLKKVHQKLSAGQDQIKRSISHLNQELSLEIHKIGLETDQEEYILNHVEDLAEALHNNFITSQPIEKVLSETIVLLNDLAHAQNKIISHNLSSNTQEDSNTITDDIELF